MRVSFIKNIKNDNIKLTYFFEVFSENDSFDSASKCSGYLELMVEFKTFFFLSLDSLVMNPVEELNTQLQFSKIGVFKVMVAGVNLWCSVFQLHGG